MPFVERARAWGFLMSESPTRFSRDSVVIASGAGKLAPGTVLGKITAPGQPNTGKFVPSPATGTDGSQSAVAILGAAVDATSTDVPAAVLAREGEVAAAALAYDVSVNDATKKTAKATQLAAVGIAVR